MVNDHLEWEKRLRRLSRRGIKTLLGTKTAGSDSDIRQVKRKQRAKKKQPANAAFLPLTSCLCWMYSTLQGREPYITFQRGGILGMDYVQESQRELPFYHSH